MNMKSAILVCAACFICICAAHMSSAFAQCGADGDVNNDGSMLSVADQTLLGRYLSGEDVSIPVLYKADLNGDCTIDFLDFWVYEQFFTYGMSAFDPYGGYPVPTCCEPDTIRGACCFGDSCAVLSPENCLDAGGFYLGDGSLCDPNPCDSCMGQYPGDVNSDGQINVGDPVFLINYLEKAGPGPNPASNGDLDGDCCIGYGDYAMAICMYYFPNDVDPVDCTCLEPPRCDGHCLPGDANNDSTYSVADAVYIINYIFAGGPGPYPFALLGGDANGDGILNVGDAVFLIAFIFNGGDPPINCGAWFQANTCLHPDGSWIFEPPPSR